MFTIEINGQWSTACNVISVLEQGLSLCNPSGMNVSSVRFHFSGCNKTHNFSFNANQLLMHTKDSIAVYMTKIGQGDTRDVQQLVTWMGVWPTTRSKDHRHTISFLLYSLINAYYTRNIISFYKCRFSSSDTLHQVFNDIFPLQI